MTCSFPFLFFVCFFVCLFVYFCRRIFALNLHARTTAPASRDLQENDIDVYVRLDLLATTVKKVTLKIREMDSFFMFLFFYFNIVVHFLEGPRFRSGCTYDTN